jgi:rhodanese-related sulfurtransferase
MLPPDNLARCLESSSEGSSDEWNCAGSATTSHNDALSRHSLWDTGTVWFDGLWLVPHNPGVLERGVGTIPKLAILAFCAAAGCRSSSSSHVSPTTTDREVEMSKTDVTAEEAHKLLGANSGYIYLDVRSIPEFEAGRPPGAINIPIAEPNPSTGQMEFNPNFRRIVDSKIPHDAKVIVGCKSGGRSARACEFLRGEGYTNVLNMVGGFGGVTSPDGQIVEPGWSTSGYPIEKGDAGERNYNSISKKIPPP